MKLIIDISEDTAKEIKDNAMFAESIASQIKWDVTSAIVNGTPLPKGHGDLKDMEDIYEALEGWDGDTGWIVDVIDCQAPTIIEADKAESEDKE